MPAPPGPEVYEERNLLSVIGIHAAKLPALGRSSRRGSECELDLQVARRRLEELYRRRAARERGEGRPHQPP